MIILVAKFRTNKADRNKMMELSNSMIEPFNKEDGCISYEFFQSPSDPGSFMFFERWKRRIDLDLHFQMPYFKKFSDIVPEILAEKESIITYEVSKEDTIT